MTAPESHPRSGIGEKKFDRILPVRIQTDPPPLFSAIWHPHLNLIDIFKTGFITTAI
jgi:hypothetical protein